MGMGEGCFRVDADPLERAQNILGCWGISTSSSSLTEHNFTYRRPFPTLLSRQQNQHQKCNLHKIYASSFIVVLACGAHLFIFLTSVAHYKITQYTDGKY